MSDFYHMVRRLLPRDDAQKSLNAEVLRISVEVGQIRASAVARESSSIPIPFLVALVFWLTALFAGFVLFASKNLIAAAALDLKSDAAMIAAASGIHFDKVVESRDGSIR